MYSLKRHTFWALGLAAMVASMFMVGCGSKGGDSAAAPGTISPTGPTAATCQPNQLSTAYGCLYQYSCQNGYAWLPQETRCVQVLPGSGNGVVTSGNYLGSLTITDRATFETFLSNMGQCSTTFGGYDWGASNCRAYSHAGFLIVQAPGASASAPLPSQATVIIGAGASFPNQPNTSGYTNYVLRPGFVSSLSVYQSGFTGNGPNNFRMISTSLPGNSYTMTVDLMYNQTTFARATVTAQ